MGLRIKAVGWMFRKHYAENRNKYIAVALGTFGIPLLMTLMSRMSETMVSWFTTIALFDIFYVMHLTVSDMRKREKMLLSNTLPISNVERYLFVLLNTTVVLAVWFVVVYGASLLLATTLYPPKMPMIFELSLMNHYIYVGFIGTHAIALLVNLVVRRRVFIPYFVAMVAVVAVQYLISKYVSEVAGASDTLRLDMKMWCNVAVALIAWPLGYIMLKRRQVKI